VDGQTLRNEVLLIGDRLHNGGQVSGEVCPKCRGGLSGEKSLSVVREGSAVSWHCHRSSCDFTGAHGVPLTEESLSTAVPPAARRHYPPKLVGVPNSILDLLEEKYRISRQDVKRQGFMWSYMDGGRLAMPIKTRWMNEIGHSFRSLRGASPKNRILLYAGVGNPSMSWYMGKNEMAGALFNVKLPVVVVEDQLSAIRASSFANSVALLGTNLSNVKAVDITKVGAKHVIIAFDKDASASAARYVRQFNPFFEKLSMVQLEKDLKDSTDDEIRSILSSVGAS